MIDQPAPALGQFRNWLLAAAAYNLAWGTLVVLAPNAIFDLLGLPSPQPVAFWQVVGMMVLVFAPAYWWASRDPWAHRHLVVIGWLGKLFGVAGFIGAVATGQLPLAFAPVILANDLLWLPAFSLFVWRVGQHDGWRTLILGGRAMPGRARG